MTLRLDWRTATERLWHVLDGDPAAPGRLVHTPRPAGILPSRLPVADLARASVAVCALAAAELAGVRNAGPAPRVLLDDGAVGAAFLGERLLRVGGDTPVGFAPLSGFWRTADGWVRTHANYPHHRARLLTAFGLPPDSGPARLAAALGALPSAVIEQRAYSAGALAVVVRPPGAREAADRGPLLEYLRLEVPRAAARQFTPLTSAVLLPAMGVRVLDLTRTIAGPVATRTLALLGADVLRIDHPGMSDAAAHLETGSGKRSALLDLSQPNGHAVLDDLLGSADVVVTGYRPGALHRFGLGAEALAERRPGLVVGRLSAWGRSGAWAGRRGFDSLVQAATGIAATESGDDGRPGALPCQALDHGTGYLLAAGILRALAAQASDGATRLVRAGLAATARWLTDGVITTADGTPVCSGRAPGAEAAPAGGSRVPGSGDRPGAAGGGFDPGPWLGERDAAAGRTVYALPAVAFEGGPRDWASAAGRWGADAPVWLPR